MDNCKRCNKKYDYTEKENCVSQGIFTVKTKCPHCGQIHRSDYLSNFVSAVSFMILISALASFLNITPISNLPQNVKLAMLIVGVIGIFTGLKITKVVAVE
ncbi:MAG: hypothetical protein ACRBCS_08055 [Cellvibrionaceae bacterium]